MAALELRNRLSEERVEQALTYVKGCTHLGIYELKPEQQEAVQLLLEEKNVFVTLPTGYGKSAIYCHSAPELCWELALLSHRLSFFRDQVAKLWHSGLQTVMIGVVRVGS